MANADIIKYDKDNRWVIVRIEDLIYFLDTEFEPSTPLETPGKHLVDTSYYPLAERFLDDLSI